MKRMNLSTIKSKIILGISVIILMILTNSFLTILSLKSNKNILQEIISTHEPAYIEVDNLQIVISKLKNNIINWVVSSNSEDTYKIEYGKLINTNIPRILNNLETLIKDIDENDFKEIQNINQNIREDLLPKMKYITVSLNSQLSYQDSVLMSEMSSLVQSKSEIMIISDDILKRLDQLKINIKNIITVKENSIKTNQSFINNKTILMSLLIIIIVIIIVLILIKIIKQPIESIDSTVIQLGKGDLPKEKLIETNSEIGQINKSLNQLIERLKNAISFAKDIERGDINKEFKLISDKDELGISLLEMRDSLKKAKDEEENRLKEENQRNWATHGLAKFSDILRKDNNDIEKLSYNIISNLIKYLEANQGGIFILKNDENINDNNVIDKSKQYYNLEACFAFDRKKYSEKQIMWGEGLVGRCGLEMKSIYMTNIPTNYITITSGLGDSTPSSLLLVPLLLNEEIFGVIEIASLNELPKHQIEFVEKIGESIAATISSVQIAIKTSILLENSQQQQEEMKAQEEEMRQNIEEMQATRDESDRQQRELEANNRQTNAILENSQDAILIVSKKTGKITLSNKTTFVLTGYSETELKNKDYKIILKFLKLNKVKQGDKKRQKVICKDGSKFMADIFVGEETINEQEMILLFIKDVTRQIKQEQDVVRNLEIAEKQKREILLKEKELQGNIEEMQAQDEELRQNLEEMQAIQDDMNASQKNLEENNKKTNAILNNAVSAILIISKNTGKIDLANKTTSNLTGYTEEDMKNMDYKTIFKFLKLDKVKQGDKKRQKAICKDGSKFMADIIVGEETINEQEMILLFVDDVTLKIKQEQEIIRNWEIAEKQKRDYIAREKELLATIEKLKSN